MDNLIFNIKKIVDRKIFCDYLIETNHPSLGVVKKVISVNGPEKMAISHIRQKMDAETTVSSIIDGMFDEKGRFPSNNTYWGWSTTTAAWFTQSDVIASQQGAI
jgi:hypothetical protein